MDWNPKTETALTTLWKRGLTAVEIAEQLGTTKGTVLGKVRRLGLPPRAAVNVPPPTPKHANRETWMMAFVEAARPVFEEIGAPLPASVRVGLGFPSKGMRSRVIGECWQSAASSDKAVEIFIRPSLQSSTQQIAGTLTHELVHAARPNAKHGPAFKRAALALGLTGKMTETTEGPEWHKWADPIIEHLGAFPGAALRELKSGRKTQTTRMKKLVCDECAWACRTTRAHIDAIGEAQCPTGCGGRLGEGS